MYKDIISYKLAEGVTEEQLFTVAQRVFSEWMSKQPGFIKWEIHQKEEGGYSDIVYWESKDAAKNAEKNMVNIPNGGEWFSCYAKDSISSTHLISVKEFK